MRFKKMSEDEPGLNITPLIDIVFLILIFFILTSHFKSTTSFSIKLPDVKQNNKNYQQQKVTIIMDKNGQTYLDGKKIGLKLLKEEFQKLVQNHQDLSVLLEADKEVRHGRVVQLMDIAKSSGVAGIIIAAQWEPSRQFN